MKIHFAATIVLAICGFMQQSAHAFDPSRKILCGTNDKNEIWCTNFEGMEHGSWERVPGSLKQVLVRDGRLWGITPKGEIFYSADIRNPHWVRLEGSAKEISEGHGLLCIVNNKDEVFCADQGITTPKPEWKKAPHGDRLRFVSIN